MPISQQQLAIVMPHAAMQVLEMFADQFNQQLPAYQLDTPLRLSAFLAQGAEETNELRQLAEILYYSTAERVQQVWPSHFPTAQSAVPYLRNPQLLGNYVYANRLGNGDVASGDGYRYRGRGWFCATGKDFYQRLSDLTHHDFILNPDDLVMPAYAVQSACCFWQAAGLNAPADAGNITAVTKTVNGELTDLTARLAYYKRAKQAFGADGTPQ